MAFAKGVADEDYPVTGMLTRMCRYQAKDYALVLLTTQFDKPEDAINAQHMLIGKLQAVPNDADSAVLQLEQSNLNNPAIFYVRQGVAVDLRILGSYYKSEIAQTKALKAMQESLLQLRRLP